MSQDVWRMLSDSSADPNPVFMAADLETPLGFATFLACSSNFKKIYISGTYNMGTMLKQLPIQGSSWLVCDEQLYQMDAPAQFHDTTAGIKHVLVAGKANNTTLFKGAKAQAVDPVACN